MALRCLSSSMFRYRLVEQRVPAMWRSLAAARLMAELPSGKAPTTRVRRRISRKSVEDNFAKALEKGLALVKGHDAVYLPGWCGPASDD